MKADISSVRHFRFVHLLLTILTSFIVCAPRTIRAELRHPTLHELVAIAAGGERLWYHEEEFLRDPFLRARPHQVVILHLEPGAKGGKPVRNIIPYLFAETDTFNFCVPKKDPHIRSLELVREGSGDTVVHVQRGAPCKTRTIAAGLYRLVVEHNSKGIGAAGKKAFLHVPRLRNTNLASSASGSFSCDALSTIMAPNGNFVVQGADANGTVQAPSTAVDLQTGGWQMCVDFNGDYTVQLPRPNTAFHFYSGAAVFPNPGDLFAITDLHHPYALTDLGDFQFTMKWAYNSATQYPITLGADNFLHWVTSGAATTFTIPVKYYQPGTTIPPLQAGEVALFHGCNYDTTYGTWVVRGNLGNAWNFLYKSPFLGRTDLLNQSTTNVSVRIGPDTVASFYVETGYRIPFANVGEDVSCTGSLDSFGSIKIASSRDFIIATNLCRNCNLSGVDLSGLDLSGGIFSGSTFANANLTNTDFETASVDNANFPDTSTLLAGASFVDAYLDHTNFRGAALTQTNFQSTAGLLVSDFTTRPDLTGATLDLHTFLPSDWRWLTLTSTTINGINGATLSTLAHPLDLSGAILNYVSLPNVVLDGANFGCASTDNGLVCTQLLETALTAASLKKANFVDALLQGAHLDFANLDSADLCAAKLNESPTTKLSATLQGAFLRNVNFSQADLTGAFLANANFYSTATTSSCSPSACGFTSSCASAVNATLNNVVFTGAYLDGVDFSASTPQSADFSNTSLAGSHFTNANLSQDPATGKRTDFTGALLQGTTFTNAIVTGANFTSAVVDLTNSKGKTVLVQLNPATHIAFPGYTPWIGSTLGCVEFSTAQITGVPATNTSNLCPDGAVGADGGACSTTQWQSPRTPPTPLPTNCTTLTTDLNWIIVN